MFTSRFTQSLRKSRPFWVGLILAIGTASVGYSSDNFAANVDPVTGVPNYHRALFGSDLPSASVRANQGFDEFGPNPNAAPGQWSQPGNQPTAPHRTYKPGNDANNLWQTRPVAPSPLNPPPVDPVDPVDDENEEPVGEELVDLRLTTRYGNPVVERFVKGTSINQLANLVLETSRLIDSRHVEPTTYQARVAQSVENLRLAIRNPAFRRVHGMRTSPTQDQAFIQEMDRYVASQTVRSANEMIRVMTGVASIAGRQVGLSPSAVAAEFIYGATESLDKFSAFNPEAPRRMPSVSTGLENSVVGIGVEIQPHDEGVIVLKAIRNSPAEKGGLQRGDILTAINGQNLKGRTMDFAVDQIGGPQGTPVLVNLMREGRPMQLSLRRDRVRVYSVNDVQLIEPTQKIGYIKLDKFAESSSEEMDEALWSLHRQGMQSLILDLRGNPGGLLTAAIEISDKFLPSGTIVSTRGRTAEDNTQESATRPQTWKVPLVVLIDGNSASASEIFAAAVQENGRGLVVGRRSYGKGTVQTHFPLSTVSGNLKITTAHFYSPTGRPMADAGVTPDIEVARTKTEDVVLPLLSERDVQAALQAAAGTHVRDLANAVAAGNTVSQR